MGEYDINISAVYSYRMTEERYFAESRLVVIGFAEILKRLGRRFGGLATEKNRDRYRQTDRQL